MAAPFKIQSKMKTVLYSVEYAGYQRFSSKSGSVTSKVFKDLREKLNHSQHLTLIRTTTTKETLIVP